MKHVWISFIKYQKEYSEFSMNNYYPFINTPLPYAYNALEPYIDEKTMHLHHDRHLQTYIDNLNHFLEENPALQKYSLEELLASWCRLPAICRRRFATMQAEYTTIAFILTV